MPEWLGDGFLAGSEYYLATALLSFDAYRSFESFNNGSGFIMPTYMIGYQNPNVRIYDFFFKNGW